MHRLLALNTPDGQHQYIMFVHAIGRHVIVKEMIIGCKKLKKFIVEQGEVAEVAATAALELCAQPRCAKIFKEIGMVELFRRLRQSKETKEIAARFLMEMEDESSLDL
jgi:hypothetical protein